MPHDARPEIREDASSIVELIPALRAFARSFCREQYDADDLVQETLTKAIANLDRYQSGTRLKSWLFTIMRNTFYNRITVLNREAPGAASCVASRPVSDPGQEWSVRAREMQRAIDKLPPRQREVVVLVGMLGVSYKETAEICNCDIGTVKSRLNRSRNALLHELGEQTSAEFLMER